MLSTQPMFVQASTVLCTQAPSVGLNMHRPFFSRQAAGVHSDIGGFGVGFAITRLNSLVVDEPPDLGLAASVNLINGSGVDAIAGVNSAFEVGISSWVDAAGVFAPARFPRRRALEIVAEFGECGVRPFALQPTIEGLAFELLLDGGTPINAGVRAITRQRQLFRIFRPVLLGRAVLQVRDSGVFETRTRIVVVRAIDRHSGCPFERLVLETAVGYRLPRVVATMRRRAAEPPSSRAPEPPSRRRRRRPAAYAIDRLVGAAVGAHRERPEHGEDADQPDDALPQVRLERVGAWARTKCEVAHRVDDDRDGLVVRESL